MEVSMLVVVFWELGNYRVVSLVGVNIIKGWEMVVNVCFVSKI